MALLALLDGQSVRVSEPELDGAVSRQVHLQGAAGAEITISSVVAGAEIDLGALLHWSRSGDSYEIRTGSEGNDRGPAVCLTLVDESVDTHTGACD